ncbi:MAG: amino acid ABC transporter substrate-binding protein [Atopobiaceae bacterium]|nr:amino acid ABC transporter substrate-binding protein [Atopobiaceae bacterium]
MSKSTITRRSFIGAASTSMLGLVLTACGGSSGSTGATATDAAASADYTLITPGKLTCVSDMAFPPMDYMEGDTYTGYEVELMEAIATKMGLEIAWLPPTKFDTIIPLIKQGGKADVGASSFTITDERKEEIDFSDSYLDSNQGVATLKSAGVKSEEDLNVEGKKIGVQSGTTGEMWAKENLTNATIVPLDDPVQAMSGMSTGLYDAVAADLPVMSYLCAQSYTDCEVSIEIPTGEQYGLVVSKDNPGLTAALNEAYAAVVADGTEAELQKKWFGAEL